MSSMPSLLPPGNVEEYRDTFCLRPGEWFSVFDSEPAGGRWIAVMLRSFDSPPGEVIELGSGFGGGGVVRNLAILAAAKMPDSGKWVWQQLSPISKELIGNHMVDGKLNPNRWYYVLIHDPLQE